MDQLYQIFEHRSYTVAQVQHGDNRSTPKKPAGGFLSPSSIGLVSSPPSQSTPTSPSKSKSPRPASLWSSPKRGGDQPTAKPANQRAASAELDEALVSMRKARRLANRDPAVAAMVLWQIAKDLVRFRQQHDNLKVTLETTQACLLRMSDQPELRGAKGSAATWSARSLLKTTLECDLAMARLQWAADKPSRAAKQYLEAVCRFLGTDPGAIARIQKAGGVEDMHAQAVRIAASIPRKFAKSEDVDQALDALGEAASAQLACADGESRSIQAQLGAAVYLLCHALALEKQRLDEAFQTALKLIASFHALGIRYLADGCAVLILDHHMSQPEARMHIASAAISSLDSSDLVRSQTLLRSYNHSFEEPWSRFLATVVDKTIDADVDWMSSRAMDEWSDVRLNSPQDSQRVCELIQAALLKHVEPYIWYTPAPFCSK